MADQSSERVIGAFAGNHVQREEVRILFGIWVYAVEFM